MNRALLPLLPLLALCGCAATPHAPEGYTLVFADEFDRVVVNDDLDRAVAEALAIVSDFVNNG